VPQHNTGDGRLRHEQVIAVAASRQWYSVAGGGAEIQGAAEVQLRWQAAVAAARGRVA